TEEVYPDALCIHELFEVEAARTPDAVAVVSGEERVTYAQLNARANRLARHLRGLGVGREARVALCLERSAEMVVGLLATLKAGGAYVPLDPQHPAKRLAEMLADCGAVAVLAHAATKAAASGVAPDGVPVVDLDGGAAAWAGADAHNLG